jgi:DNA-directed RNA polymerase subunit RPC12/RpoP
VKTFRLLGVEAAPERVLGSEKETPTLQQQVCYRCGKDWWPRTPKKPARCPACKSPYWDRPRRLKATVQPLKGGVHAGPLANNLRRDVAFGLPRRNSGEIEREDRSLEKALAVLKDMKAAGRTWQEMAERVERKFGTRLDKDQLKALVR